VNFTIIIPTWNNLKYFKMAVESMERHKGGHGISYVFVNNGSTDGTTQYIQKAVNRVVVHNSQNVGVTKAWNQGVAAALQLNQDIICICNDDVIAGYGFLDSVARAHVDHPKAYFLPFGASSIQDFERNHRAYHNQFDGVTHHGICGWCMYFPRRAVNLFHPIPEEFELWHNDDWIHTKLHDAGWTPLVAKGSIMYHFGGITFYKYPNYTDRVEKDRQAFFRINKGGRRGRA